MVIYFDRKTLSILKYIYRSGDRGVSWEQLRSKYGDKAPVSLLVNLDIAEYTVTKDQNGNWIYDKDKFRSTHGTFRSFCTSKGNELIETRCFNFWKWIIPTIISIVALVVSFIGTLQ